MSKATPGPWKASPVSSVVGSLITSAGGNIAAAIPRPTKEETEANASLIEAAHDLLAACKLALESLRAWNEIGIPLDARASCSAAYEQSPEIRALVAAIAKAEPLQFDEHFPLDRSRSPV